MVQASALGLALAAAALHALWNVVLARARDPEAATAVAFVVAVVAWAPVAVARWRVEPGAWPYVAASAALELAYVALLAAAYARAELSLVYPLARGLAPVLVLAVATLALGAGSSPAQGAGVGAVGIGILLVRAGGRAGRGAGLAIAIAAAIAGYTLVDNSGVTRADPLAYLEAVMAAPALAYAALLTARRGRAALAAAVAPATVAVGPLILAPYALALFALRIAPAAPVAAVRESGVLLVTALAALLLKERVGAARGAGAALVVAGIVLIGV